MSNTIVRPHNSASLILLRDSAQEIEVLMGRRARNLRFMPGHLVYPGGQLTIEDRMATAAFSKYDQTLPRLHPDLDQFTQTHHVQLASAALRETLEETGHLPVNHLKLHTQKTLSAPCSLNEAYQQLDAAPPLSHMHMIGRAITPRFSRRRYHNRFFMVDQATTIETSFKDQELEAVDWYPVSKINSLLLADVTELMLQHALRLRNRTIKPVLLIQYRGNSCLSTLSGA